MDKLNSSYEKSIKEVSTFMAKLMIESEKRDDDLTSKIIPLLKQKTIKKIVDYKKNPYIFFRQNIPPDDVLLRRYLDEKILDFDCNIHYLTSEEMPALAKIINKNPFVSFWDGLD